MKTGFTPLLWGAAALILLLSAVVLGLNMVTVPLVMVPYAVLFAQLPGRYFSAAMLIVWAAAYLLIGPLGLLTGVFFAVPAIVMGWEIRKRSAAKRVITAGTLTLLAMLVLQLAVFTFVFDYSLVDEVGAIIRESVAQMVDQGALPENWNADLTESFIRTLTQSVPLALMVTSFVYAAGAYWLTRRALKLHGVETPRFKRAKDWMLPKVLVLYYLVVLILDMMIPADAEGFLYVALLNLLPLLRFAFGIQTIGFFFFLADQKRWNRAIPLLLAIPVLLFPPLSLIGVLDVAFPIRKSFVKP